MPTPTIELEGRCVKEPKCGTDRNGNPYIFVRVACSDSRKTDTGWETMRELFVDVEWFRCDKTMRIPQVGDFVRVFGRMYETTREHEGIKYRDVKCDAYWFKAYERKQPSTTQGWGGIVEQHEQQQAQQQRTQQSPPQPPQQQSQASASTPPADLWGGFGNEDPPF